MASDRRRLVPHASHWGAFLAEVEDGRLVGVRPVGRDSVPSPILASIPDSVYGPTRIDQPYVRAGYLQHGPESDRTRRGAEPFVPVPWDTVLGLVAREVARVKIAHGNDSIFAGSYGWASAGRLHHARTLLHRFTNGYGGSTQQVTNYSYAAGMVVVPRIVGDTRTVSGPNSSWDGLIGNTTLLVAFGGLPTKNMQIESGGGGEHTGAVWLHRVAQAKIPVVHIGPIRNDVASELEPEWLSPAPGTDTALMLGLAHTLIVEGLHDQTFLDRYTVGYDRLRAYILGESDGRPKDAPWAAGITGLDAPTVRGLARRMAENRTFLTMSWALQRAEYGEQPFWMLIALAAILGQVGLPGGGFGFGYGSMNGMGNPRPNVVAIERAVGPNPARRVIPVARISDMLLHPGVEYDFDGKRLTYPDVRLVYWCGGNPFHHHQDLNRLLQAWQRPESIIVHDIWWTPTARHADIVLPATTSLERNDIACSLLDRYFLAMHQAIAPVGLARNDFDIFTDLAD
ncbi:MAG: Asp-tRNA(Asn)/Glu-tRNA(Gln) amidotransferase GatCAB subunit C, partial [Alphaproteobacteria bacterium]|nr:Asp-tRNA(Asn)/Glu-tRNA(Gln) amidotransferase GatCAB subunit C [Alphaproteobacteria bacterium]